MSVAINVRVFGIDRPGLRPVPAVSFSSGPLTREVVENQKIRSWRWTEYLHTVGIWGVLLMKSPLFDVDGLAVQLAGMCNVHVIKYMYTLHAGVHVHVSDR